MTDLRKAAEMALKDLTRLCHAQAYDTVEALRQALAEPKREWVGLTDEEKGWCGAPTLQETVSRVEAKLKEKNT